MTVPPFVAVDNGSGFSFDATDYVGAVEPGTSADADPGLVGRTADQRFQGFLTPA